MSNQPEEQADPVSMLAARIVIERRLIEDDLVDHIEATDAEGEQIPLVEALGMLRLAEHVLMRDGLDYEDSEEPDE